MASLLINEISKSFGSTKVLRDISLDVSSGDFFFILGASGCGKSTLLRIIAGLEQQDSGGLSVDGVSISNLQAHERGIGMVFQQYALWPHMTVNQNIAFGLEVKGVPRLERQARISEALELVRMAELGLRYPHELSGGQQQRVALARALAIRPKIVLLDEPLSNLDAKLREEIREELQALHEQLKITMVYVTHDQEDALSLATRIALLRNGRVEQVGSPQELYNTPHSRYAAEFLGSANILNCTVEKSPSSQEALISVRDGTPSQFVARTARSLPHGGALLCVRPENVEVIVQPSAQARPSIPATVRHVTFKGGYLDIECETSQKERILSRTVSSRAPTGLLNGMSVRVEWDPSSGVVVEDSSRS